MPLPNPKKNETESEFISRCASEASSEFEGPQLIAVCYKQWEKMSKEEFEYPSRSKEKLVEFIPRCMTSKEVKEMYKDRFERASFCMSSFSMRYKNNIGKKWN